MKTVYIFDAATGEYRHPYNAQESPLEPGEFIEPILSTPMPPPDLAVDQAAVFSKENNEWSVVPDFRGQTFYDQTTGAATVIDALGPLSANLGASPPPPTVDELRKRARATLPAWEESERAGGIEHAGHEWLTTPAAVQDIRDALLAGMVPTGAWINAAREPVPMNLPDLQTLWTAMVTRGAEIYQRRLQMEVAIANMTAVQLAAFKPGWPE